MLPGPIFDYILISAIAISASARVAGARLAVTFLTWLTVTGAFIVIHCVSVYLLANYIHI